MKAAICLLGLIIIVGSIIVYLQSEIVVEKVENPDYRRWALEWVYSNSTSEPDWSTAPPRWLYIEHITYPNSILAGVIFLVGFVAVVTGAAIPEKER